MWAATREKAQFGVAGLDDICSGGLARGSLFLLEGSPETGKTTVACDWLLSGVEAGESCLDITWSESDEELWASAASHGLVGNMNSPAGFKLGRSPLEFQRVLRGIPSILADPASGPRAAG